MGKKTTKRKTRWRALSIGEVPSDTEEDSQENSSTYQGEYPYHRTNNGKPHYYQQRSAHYSNAGGAANSTYKYTNYSSQSTPTRNRNYHYQHSGEKYKSSRSNSTASEPKITFNEDEYTRITTPRQDVLFKKGYLSKKKPVVAPTPADGVTTASSVGAPSSGSCGDSNPSTGYSSTTGGGTPEHHSQDGGEYRDGEFDQQQQFIFPNGFVDSNGIYFVNAGVPPGFEYGPMMLVGPAGGQFIHPLEFYPPAPAMCFPPYGYRGKRYSTDSQTESASPHNETDSSNKTTNTGNECSSSSVPSSSNGGDNGLASSSCTDDPQPNGVEDNDPEGGAPMANATQSMSDHETAVGATQGIPVGMGMGTVPPSAMFPPTQFIFPAPHPGFLPYPPSHHHHHQMYLSGIQLQGSTGVSDIVEPKRYKKRRRRKTSRLPNEANADGDYTDDTTSSSDENDSEPIPKREILIKNRPESRKNSLEHINSNPTSTETSVDLLETKTNTNDSSIDSIESSPTHTPNSIDNCDMQVDISSGESITLSKSNCPLADQTISANQTDKYENSINEISLEKDNASSNMDNDTVFPKCNGSLTVNESSEVSANPNQENLIGDEKLSDATNICAILNDTTIEINGTEQTNKIISENHTDDSSMTSDLSDKESETLHKLESDSKSINQNDQKMDSGFSDSEDKNQIKLNTDKINKDVVISLEIDSPTVVEEPVLLQTTIYKVDAEEFIPMSMRVQQQPATETVELRAKFENYLNRNDSGKPNPFELQIAKIAQSAPETEATTPIEFVPNVKQKSFDEEFDPKNVPEFVPRNGSGDFAPLHNDYVSKSFPPKRDNFGHHNHGVSKKYYNNGSHYNQEHFYSGYKRRHYGPNDKYYQRQNGYHHRHMNGHYKDQNGYHKMNHESTTEKEKITPSEISKPDTTVLDNKVANDSKDVTSGSSKNHTEINDKENHIKEIEKTFENSDKQESNQSNTEVNSLETSKKPILNKNVPASNISVNHATNVPKRSYPPGFCPKPQKPSHNHLKPMVPPISTQQVSSSPPQTSPINVKNYAQIVKKSQTHIPNEVLSPVNVNETRKPISGTVESNENLNSSPIRIKEDEWISVSSRKKGKSKQVPKSTVTEHNDDSPHKSDTYGKQVKSATKNKTDKQTKQTNIPKVTETPTKQVDKKITEIVIEKVKEVKITPKKPEIVLTEKSDTSEIIAQTTSSENTEKLNEAGDKKSQERKKSSEKLIVEIKKSEEKPKEKLKEKPIEKSKEKPIEKSKEKPIEKSKEKLIDTSSNLETPTKKSKQKMKLKNKKPKSPKTTDPNSLSFDIVEGIDNINKSTDDTMKTNVEISLEIDRLIQKGLYANMEQTIKSLGGNTDAFLSIVNPGLSFASPKSIESGSISPSHEKPNILDVMETLGECQRMFAYKSMKDYSEVKSPTKDIDVRALKVLETKVCAQSIKPDAKNKERQVSSEENKSLKKGKKNKVKNKSGLKLSSCEVSKVVDHDESNEIKQVDTLENEVQPDVHEENEALQNKKESLDMHTVNAILRDLSAERKRELQQNETENTSNLSIDEIKRPEENTQDVAGGNDIEIENENITDQKTESEQIYIGQEIVMENEILTIKNNVSVLSELNSQIDYDAIQISEGGEIDTHQLCNDTSSPIVSNSEKLSVDEINPNASNDEVITQEPHIDKNNIFVPEDNVLIKNSPDITDTTISFNEEDLCLTRSSSTEEQNVSITEAVRNWLHETKEKSPEVEVLKSPEKLQMEGKALLQVYTDSDTDDSDLENGHNFNRTGPKNVKGNPLFAASANSNNNPVHINDTNENISSSSIEKLWESTSEFRNCENSLMTGEDALMANRRVASNVQIDNGIYVSRIEHGQEVNENFETDNRLAKKEYGVKITENVVNIAREIANSVNPVVNGLKQTVHENGNVLNGYEITESGIKVRENIVKVINGTTVRDVAVIKRTISENGAIFNDVNSLLQNDINDAKVNNYIQKSKSCIEMNNFCKDINVVKQPLQTEMETPFNGEHDTENSVEPDLLECWDNDLNVNSFNSNSSTTLLNNSTSNAKRNISKNIQKISNNFEINSKQLNSACGNHVGTLNECDETKTSKEKLKIDESAEDVLEVYESMYGKNLDYLEIKQKVRETANQIPVGNLKFPSDGDGTVPPCGGAVCCNVM